MAANRDTKDQHRIEKLDKSLNEDFIVQMVDYLCDEGMSSTAYQDFSKEYKRGWNFYHGRQELDDGLSGFLESEDEASQVVRDICFRTIRRINPLLTDARPVQHIKADNPDEFIEEIRLKQQVGLLPVDQGVIQGDQDIADDLKEAWWDLQRSRMEEARLSVALGNMTVGGMAWRIPYWSKKHAQDPGELRIKDVKDSTTVVLDPYLEEIDLSDQRYAVILKEMDLHQLKAEYRLSDADIRRALESGGRAEDPEVSYQTLFKRKYGDEDFTGVGVWRTRVRVKELWYWGQTPLEMTTEGPSKAVAHPNGRVFSTCGQVLLQKPMSNPFWNGKLPGVPFRDNPDPTTPYGWGEIKWLVHDQLSINVLVNQILANAVLMGNGGYLAEKGAFVSEPTNAPGEIKTLNPGKLGAVREIQGTGMPPGLGQLMGMFASHASNRVNETVQGLPPGAQSSGVAISHLQDAALSIIREKARWLEWAYSGQGSMEVSLMQQNGSGMMFNQFVRDKRMHLGMWNRWHDRMRALLYTISVESRAEMPMNIMDRMKVALQQHQSGLIDGIEALEFMKFPRSKRLIEKMEVADAMEKETAEFQREQLAMQRQAAQGGAPAQIPGAGPGQPQAPPAAPGGEVPPEVAALAGAQGPPAVLPAPAG